MFVNKYLSLLSMRTQNLEHFTFNCLLHVSTIFCHNQVDFTTTYMGMNTALPDYGQKLPKHVVDDRWTHEVLALTVNAHFTKVTLVASAVNSIKSPATCHPVASLSVHICRRFQKLSVQWETSCLWSFVWNILFHCLWTSAWHAKPINTLLFLFLWQH